LSIWLLAAPPNAAAQNAFYDARLLADHYEDYALFLKNVARSKRSLRDSLQKMPESQGRPYELLFVERSLGDLRRAEWSLANMAAYFKDPFDQRLAPLDVRAFQAYSQQAVQLSIVVLRPFVDSTRTIYNSFYGYPLARYDVETKRFYDLRSEHEAAIRPVILDPSATENDTLLSVKALYNPLTGGVHNWDGGQFSVAPNAYFNVLDKRFYRTLGGFDLVTDFDLADNAPFLTKENLLVIYTENVIGDSLGVYNALASIGKAWAGDVENYAYEKSSGSRSPAISGFIASPAGATSGAAFSTLAVDALAQFLVERVKGELSVAFFDRFLEEIDNTPELQALFPNTYYMLKNKDIFRVPTMGELWVEAFQGDMSAFLANCEKMLLTEERFSKYRQNTSVKAFLLAYNLADMILKNERPADIFTALDNKLGGYKDEVGLVAKGLDIMSQNLRKAGVTGRLTDDLIPFEEFRKLTEAESELFVSLLYQSDRTFFDSLKTDKGGTFGRFMAEHHQAFSNNLSRLVRTMDKIKAAQDSLHHVPKAEKQAALKVYWLAMADNALELVDFGFRLKYFTTPDVYLDDPFAKVYRPVAFHTLRAIEAKNQQDYGKLLLHAMQAFEPLFSARKAILEEELLELRYKEAGAVQIKRMEARIKNLGHIAKNIAFYGGFMADVLSSTSSAQIKGILDRYAQPVGSYSAKRKAHFSIDLNAFPGLYVGREFLGNSRPGLVTGVTAPIGISLNWGQKSLFGKKQGHSFSAFFSFIDIGAAFSYRWNNDGEGFPAEVRWAQVVSPGVQAVWGFRKVPLSIGCGLQYTPQLRKLDASSATFDQNVWRVGISASVDVPIFGIHLKE
jgi:hypothetical protein